MKKHIVLLLAAVMLISSGCCIPEGMISDLFPKSTQAAAEPATEAPTVEPATEPTLIPTEVPTQAPTETPTEEFTEAPTEAPVPFSPYLVKIERADFPICIGPGYATGFARYLETPGTFTIVEEAYDSIGSLWGRLKSGVGWINLTQLETENARGPVLSLVEVTDQFLAYGNYRMCTASYDSYVQNVCIQANIPLQRVEIFPLYYIEAYEEDTPTCTVVNVQPGEVLLLKVSFPGDMSAWGIRVMDQNGITYRYGIWENLSGEGDPFSLGTYAPGFSYS